MSNELITGSGQDLLAQLREQNAASEVGSEQALAAVSKSAQYLPYLQLCGGNSKNAKEVGIGNYGLVQGKKATPLGESVNVMICGARAKAMTFKKPILVYYDTESEGFQELMERSKKKNSKCGWGPELLVWLPDSKTFATFFMSSPTARNASDHFIDVFKHGSGKAVFSSEQLSNEDYEWLGPTCEELDIDLVLPDAATLMDQANKFNNPPKEGVQIVDEEEVSDRE